MDVDFLGFAFGVESFDDDDDVEELDSFDDDEELGSFDDDVLSELLDESDELPGVVVAWDPRLSVLKKPDPLKVTPTGWNTFLTGRTLPDSG